MRRFQRLIGTGSKRLRWLFFGSLLLSGSFSYAATETSLSMQSDPGDYIGSGRTYFYDSSIGVFSATKNYDDGVSISYHDAAYTHWWYLDFAAPANALLTTGTYSGATRFASHDPSVPGLEVSGDGSGSNTLTGSFDVLEISYGVNNTINSFHAVFEQHSEGSAAALRGEIKFNADPSITPPIDLKVAKGFYFAVFGDMNQPGNQHTGFLQLAVRPGGAFTGKLRFASYVIPLRGRFDADGAATLTLPVRNENPAQLQLQVSRDGGGYLVAATLLYPDGTPGNFTLQRRTAFSIDFPAPMAGNYTMLLSPTQSDLFPRSAGFGAMTVEKSGRARCIIILSDGRPLTTGASVVGSASLPLFFASYRRTGAAGGTVEFADMPATDCTATFFWTKPPNAWPVLPEAVQTTLKLEGSRFVDAPYLEGASHAFIEFIGGTLAAPLSHDLAIDSNGRITVLNATSDRLRFSLSPGGTGIRGSFRSSVDAIFFGVWLQKPNFVGGLSFDRSGPGAFRIIPTDDNNADASDAAGTSFGGKF